MQSYCFKNTKPREIGREHGEKFRNSVQAMASIRLELMLQEPKFKSKQSVLELAKQHLAILENYDLDLYAELLGIAEGSHTSPEEIIVLNHYTDLRDLGACSVVFVPSPTGNLLGQTWDIHASAEAYVLLLELPGQFKILTAAGCLGLTGFNLNKVGICINNLCSLNAKIGLIWPALVRRVLKSHSAQEAKNLILQAPLGSGHHYSVADTQDFFGIECTGSQKKVVQHGCQHTHFHTNHCLDPELAQLSTIRKGSSTHTRYETLQENLKKQSPANLQELGAVLSQVSIPKKADQPHAPATCAIFAMNLHTGESLACLGSHLLE